METNREHMRLEMESLSRNEEFARVVTAVFMSRLNPTLDIFGVLLTMFDGRTNLSMQVAEEVRRFFPGKVFSTVIPRNVRLSEAPSHGLPIFGYDKFSRGAESYQALAAEVIRKE